MGDAAGELAHGLHLLRLAELLLAPAQRLLRRALLGDVLIEDDRAHDPAAGAADRHGGVEDRPAPTPSNPWMRTSSLSEVSPLRSARAAAHSSGAIGPPVSSPPALELAEAVDRRRSARRPRAPGPPHCRTRSARWVPATQTPTGSVSSTCWSSLVDCAQRLQVPGALDGDLGEVAGDLDDPGIVRRRIAALLVVVGEGAEHLSGGGGNGHRPAGAKTRPERASRAGQSQRGSVAMSRTDTGARRYAAVPQLPCAGPTGTTCAAFRYSAGRRGSARQPRAAPRSDPAA